MIFSSDKIIFPESGLIKINEIMNLGMDNTKSIGLFLYTDYFIIFQISGFLLLVAMIGAIVLAHSDLKNSKSISSIDQKNVDKENIWIIDPIDGTFNFLNSLPHFAISIGYEENGEIVSGIIFDPIKNEMFSAHKGSGAYLNLSLIHI